jgi:hypothetical protein
MAVVYQKYLDFLRELQHLNPSNFHHMTGSELAAAFASKNRLFEIISISPVTPRSDQDFKKFLFFVLNQFENESETLLPSKHFQLGQKDPAFVKNTDCISAFYGMKSALLSIIRVHILNMDH